MLKISLLLKKFKPTSRVNISLISAYFFTNFTGKYLEFLGLRIQTYREIFEICISVPLKN